MSLEENEEDIKNLSGDEEAGASEADSASEAGSEAAESSAVGDVADLSDFEIEGSDDDAGASDAGAEADEGASEAGADEGASEALAVVDTSITHPASMTSRKTKKSIEEEKDDDEDDDDEDDEDDDNEKEDYLQKFDKNFRNEFIKQYHPESNTHNYEQVKHLTQITREGERIIDGIHKTLPFLTKYEKTRVLGQRAKQINAGARPMIDVPQNIMDGYIIAKLELEQKKIPFIIKRPLPNGECEYWNLTDLEMIN
jgi:DNA-directed RNA polymerase I, II, and III subunit RPABC2